MQIVDAVTSIDTHLNPSQFINTYAGRVVAGKDISGMSFADYLNMHASQIKQASASLMTHQADHNSVSILMGYYPPLMVSPTPEARVVVNAYKSQEDL